MATEQSAPTFPDDLAAAHARIAELEAEIAQLRKAPGQPKPRLPQPPSSILECITDGFVAVDQEFRYVWVNAEAERLLGLPRDRLLGQCMWELFPDSKNSAFHRNLSVALAQATPLEFENHSAVSDRWFFNKVYPTKEGGLAIYTSEITNRMRAQENLRRHALVLEQVHDAVVALDLDGRVTRWNRGAERLFGYDAQEALGQPFASLFFENDRAQVNSNILQPLFTKGQNEVELRNRRKSGEECYARHALSLLCDEGGQPYAMLSVAIEITAQKRAEQALKSSEERFRLAFDALEGFVYDWDPRTGAVYRSGSLQKMLGIAADEAEPTETWWQQRVHPDDAAATTLNVVSRLPPGQLNFETEFRIRHADGHWVYISDRGFVVRDDNGAAIRVVGTSHDVTEQRRLERELKASNAHLKFQSDILATTNDAVIALHPDLSIRYCNAAAEKLYGVRLADVVGKPLPAMHGYAWLAPEDEQRCNAELVERGSWKGEYIHILNNGSQLVVHSTVNALAPESGGGMVAVIRDITGRKQAEIQMRHQSAQLARANKDLLHFAYAVSHDLQAPVRTVVAFSQMLALTSKTALDEKGSQLLGFLVDAGARMSTMIRDLLEFAQVAGGPVQFSDAVSFEEVLKTALANLASAIEETGAVVTHGPLPAVTGDASQLLQLFQNLIGNSLKYRKPDTPPAIHVSAQRSNTECIISVRDNGIGFDPHYSERIFEVFQRLHGKDFAGTGIGLTICKRIVERRGGRIWAEGRPGDGATFSFSVPDSLEAIPAVPAMDWERLHAVLENHPSATDPAVPAGHFDELFKLLDLAQAVVRKLDGSILVWTKGAERLFGWTAAEAVGKQLRELLSIELPQSVPEMEASLLRNGEWTGELKALKRDGTVVWLAGHKILYRDGSGRPQSVIEVHNDITALKETQAALLRSSEQRDLALRAANMGVWRWDNRTGEVEWSETLERMLGLEPGSFEGTFDAFAARSHPDDWPKTRENIEKAMQNGPDYIIENRLLRNDGSYIWVRGQGRVVFDESNRPVGLIGVVWDITERRQNEADKEFLLDLSSKVALCSDPGRLPAIAVAETAKYLDLPRCGYNEIDRAASRVRRVADYQSDGATLVGSYPLDDYQGILADMAEGSSVAVSDVAADPRTVERCQTAYLCFGIRSFLSVPLHRDGVWVASISVMDRNVRSWQEREIALLRGVAERLWPALENARLLQETRESREQFEATFEQAAVGMAQVGLDGLFLRVNQRFSQITGYSMEELLTLRFQNITYPDDLASDLAAYDALQRGEIQSYSLEKRYFHKTGSIVWINLTVSLMRDFSGQPKYAISVIEDITVRRKTAQELAESNALAELRLREIEAIYSQAPIGLFSMDNDLRYLRINDYLARNNGLPASAHIGRAASEILPDLWPHLEPIFRNVIEKREPVVEKEVRGFSPAKPGIESSWLVSYYPFAGPDGTVLGLHGVVQDTTDRKKNETLALEAADRLRIATSAAQLGVFAWSVSNNATSWENERVYEIFGRSHEEGSLGKTEFLEKVLYPDDLPAFQSAMNAALLPGGSLHMIVRIWRKGELRWIEASGHFDLDAAGTPLRLTGVIADVTDRIAAESALRDQKQHLRSVLDSLYAFVGVMNLEGVLLEANRAPLEAAGIEAADVLGKSLTDTYWFSYSTEVQNRLSDAIRQAQAGVSSRFDLPVRMKQGQLITIDFMLSPLRDETGAIKYLIPSGVPIEERKRMEEALRQSEERYRTAEWATNDGLWDWNPATDDCYFSPRFKALLGFEDSELENKAAVVFARLHPEDAPHLFEAIRLNFEDRRPYDVEMRILLKNGHYRWFHTRGEALRDTAGRVTRMIGCMTDVHDRKQSAVLAREHDDQLRQMIDSIEQLAWMAHPDGSSFWFNRRWYEYTGTTPEEMQGWGWQSVHHPDRLPEVLDRWRDTLRTGEPFDMEFPLLGADGVYRSFLTRVVPLRDSAGRIVRWFGTNTNIDALRRAQQVLKESEQKFRELAETLPELLWVADGDGAMTYSNPQWYAFTGLSPEESVADAWASFVHPDEVERLFDLWQTSLAHGTHYECEARVRRHDGVYRWFLNRAEPVRNPAGKVVKWIGTSTDIHERKLTEQALRHSNEDLEQFAYAASHDLQESLRTVSIYSQLLVRRCDAAAPDAARFSAYVVNATTRMENLLKGILAYSRAGEPTEGPASSDSELAFKTVLQNLREPISASGVTVTHDLLPRVACPPNLLLQVFENLLDNAVQYRASRPLEIHVSSTREGSWYKFSVADNGVGVRAEYLKKIFGMFKRLHRDEYPGVGIGLAICKRIVERCGGRIWAESEPGHGATFYFTLPAARD